MMNSNEGEGEGEGDDAINRRIEASESEAKEKSALRTVTWWSERYNAAWGKPEDSEEKERGGMDAVAARNVSSTLSESVGIVSRSAWNSAKQQESAAETI